MLAHSITCMPKRKKKLIGLEDTPNRATAEMVLKFYGTKELEKQLKEFKINLEKVSQETIQEIADKLVEEAKAKRLR